MGYSNKLTRDKIRVSEGTPPWCMSLTWSNNGDFIYAGRRNGTVEEISIKMPHKRSNVGHHRDTMIPNISKLLQFPKISGPVSAISTMPNDDFYFVDQMIIFDYII